MRATSPCCSTALGGPGTSVGTARMLDSGAQVRWAGRAPRLSQAAFPGLHLGGLTPADEGASGWEGVCAGLGKGARVTEGGAPRLQQGVWAPLHSV